MKLAIAGDSAGEGLAKVLAEHQKRTDRKFEVAEVSRTDAGPDPLHANLSERLANAVLDATCWALLHNFICRRFTY